MLGVLCLLAGWTYTGGPRPYGYVGLGELFVFVFFGVVATVGTTYVLLEEVDGLALACSVSVGLWAAALLVTNNLQREITHTPGSDRARGGRSRGRGWWRHRYLLVARRGCPGCRARGSVDDSGIRIGSRDEGHLRRVCRGVARCNRASK